MQHWATLWQGKHIRGFHRPQKMKNKAAQNSPIRWSPRKSERVATHTLVWTTILHSRTYHVSYLSLPTPFPMALSLSLYFQASTDGAVHNVEVFFHDGSGGLKGQCREDQELPTISCNPKLIHLSYPTLKSYKYIMLITDLA